MLYTQRSDFSYVELQCRQCLCENWVWGITKHVAWMDDTVLFRNVSATCWAQQSSTRSPRNSIVLSAYIDTQSVKDENGYFPACHVSLVHMKSEFTWYRSYVSIMAFSRVQTLRSEQKIGISSRWSRIRYTSSAGNFSIDDEVSSAIENEWKNEVNVTADFEIYLNLESSCTDESFPFITVDCSCYFYSCDIGTYMIGQNSNKRFMCFRLLPPISSIMEYKKEPFQIFRWSELHS